MLIKLSIKIAKNMYLNFDYIKIDPQYFFSFQIMLNYYFFARLLEIKIIIEGLNCRF